MNVYIDVETIKEFKRTIQVKDEELLRIFNEIKLETENMAKYFNTKTMSMVTEEMIKYIIEQNKGLRNSSNVFINKLDRAIEAYSETIASIKESVSE